MTGPEALASGGRISFGRFDARPTSADPLAGTPAPLRWWRRTRLKGWLGFLLVHPDRSTSFIVQDAKYLASSDLLSYDHRSGAFQHRQVVGPPGSLRLPPDLFGSTVRFRRPGYDIGVELGPADGDHLIRFDVAATAGFDPVRGELTLHTANGSAPLSVSSRLPGGSMFTWKQVFGVSGTLHVGGHAITYDPDRDVAIVDEHRSLLPHRTDWTWGTFAALVDDAVVGASFASRPHEAGQEEESALWVGGGSEPLSEITFSTDPDDPTSPWSITSLDGRLDVTFTPSRRHTVHRDLGLFAIDYFTMYGTYDGVVRGVSGAHRIEGVHGVCERMHARL
jgi:hypothetical protein